VIQCEVSDGVAVITINRPERRNALNRAVREGFFMDIGKIEEVNFKIHPEVSFDFRDDKTIAQDKTMPDEFRVFSEGLQQDFRSYAGRVAHCDYNGGAFI